MLSTGEELSLSGYAIAALSAYVGLILCGVYVLAALWSRSQRRPHAWKRREGHLLRRSVHSADLLIVLAVLFTLFIGVGVVLGVTGYGDDMSDAFLMVLTSATFHWPVIVTVALLLAAGRRKWRWAFGAHRARLGRHVRAGFIGYLAMLPAVVLFLILNGLVMNLLGFETDLQEVAKILVDDSLGPIHLYLLAVGIVVGPVAEELIFRGLCFPLLARRIGPSAAMIVVSILFAAIHAHPPALLPLFVVSIAFCLAYAFTNSIVTPIVMHMLFNGVNLVLLAVMM